MSASTGGVLRTVLKPGEDSRTRGVGSTGLGGLRLSCIISRRTIGNGIIGVRLLRAPRTIIKLALALGFLLALLFQFPLAFFERIIGFCQDRVPFKRKNSPSADLSAADRMKEKDLTSGFDRAVPGVRVNHIRTDRRRSERINRVSRDGQ